jgi:carboxyl-terminal processing protease
MSRLRVPAAVLVTCTSVAAGAFLGVLAAQSPAADSRQADEARYRVYAAALAAIENDYVEPIDGLCLEPKVCGSEALIYESISGMLRTLDPHSSFFTPRDFAQMRDRQEGRYFGIGISILSIDGDVTVTSLFEGSPAYRAGIRRGDIIAKVGDEDAKGWQTDEVVKRVKGPKGTTVDITIRRPGLDALIPLTVARDEIKMPTVRAAFMLTPGIGYVRLQDFSETSDTELGEALARLKSSGMQRVVLDLRDNPGGPLDQAILVANRFLKRGQMIVSTRGRIPNSDEDYRATRQGGYPDVPLIVLVNRGSASASEIVTGAMQDHDRGLVVGETTFGKALVQSVYPIANGAGLALTTGHYYTPSGRMIQRPWDSTFDDYRNYAAREQTGTREHKASELTLTDAGRKVYGGGGVEPDHFVVGPVEGFNPTRFSRSLSTAFINFAERFTKEGDTRPGARSNATHHVEPGWTLTDAMVDEFRQFLVDQHVKIDEAAFKTDLAFIKSRIHYEVDVDLFGVEEARRVASATDPQLQAALGYFDEAAHLLELNTSATAGRAVKAPPANTQAVR